jgi:hypothetical protein
MATLDLNDRGTSPLGHGTLGIRRDHLVLGDKQISTRLGPPRRFVFTPEFRGFLVKLEKT